METKNAAMQRKITQLAVQARGLRSRPEIVQLLDGMSLGSYFNFETGRVWPQAGNLRKIENAYGWKSGILTELTGSDVDPNAVTLETLVHGLGAIEEQVSRASELSDEELLVELMRRMTSLRDENVSLRRQTIEHTFEQTSDDDNNSNKHAKHADKDNELITKRPNPMASSKDAFQLAARRTHRHDS